MIFDPQITSLPDFTGHMTACITPRPIAWVSTLSPRGVPNLAPFSFFNAVGGNPPAVMFSPSNRRDGTRKDTVLNVEATGEFVINMVSESLAERMNDTSHEFAYEVNEFEQCGLEMLPSQRIKPPRVKQAAVHLECTLQQIVRVGEGPSSGNIIIGRVVLIHVADSVLDGQGQIDPCKLNTIGRMGGSLYTRTRDGFELPRPDPVRAR
jgi:flavin reductase (DIM6/NTAB) family NADH-FMN oxidoreductase RutF